MFTLEGLRELTRLIEVKIGDLVDRVEQNLIAECHQLSANIQARMTEKDEPSLKGFVRVDEAQKMVYLAYRMDGKKVTARNYHNPGSEKYSGRQPFQQALEDMEYTDIEPAHGSPIEESHGEAPGVRITAKLTPAVVERLKR